MPNKMSADQILAREFLEMRGKILELAASLDRLDRAGKLDREDDRHQRLLQALQLLLEARPDRAEAVQLLFSRPYDENWPNTFGMERENVRIGKAR